MCYKISGAIQILLEMDPPETRKLMSVLRDALSSTMKNKVISRYYAYFPAKITMTENVLIHFQRYYAVFWSRKINILH